MYLNLYEVDIIDEKNNLFYYLTGFDDLKNFEFKSNNNTITFILKDDCSDDETKLLLPRLKDIFNDKTKIEKIILTLSNSRGHIYLRNTFYGVFITELNYDVNISFSERQVDNCLIHTEVILSFDYFEENFKT